jgi:hypothetical protein
MVDGPLVPAFFRGSFGLGHAGNLPQGARRALLPIAARWRLAALSGLRLGPAARSLKSGVAPIVRKDEQHEYHARGSYDGPADEDARVAACIGLGLAQAACLEVHDDRPGEDGEGQSK